MIDKILQVVLITQSVALGYPIGIIGMQVDIPEDIFVIKLHLLVDRPADIHHGGRRLIPNENAYHSLFIRIFPRPLPDAVDSRDVGIRDSVVVDKRFQSRGEHEIELLFAAVGRRYKIDPAFPDALQIVGVEILFIIRKPCAYRKSAEFCLDYLVKIVHQPFTPPMVVFSIMVF